MEERNLQFDLIDTKIFQTPVILVQRGLNQLMDVSTVRIGKQFKYDSARSLLWDRELHRTNCDAEDAIGWLRQESEGGILKVIKMESCARRRLQR